ncbi:MAG: hypothetical protein IMW96_10385 [Thermoanaerobacteraceae bacterium]|nr:hypothetical protein [Thermoanaerobacteraceae bacterium]
MQGQGKAVRQWRVGSFSMALVLILLGVALLGWRRDPTAVPRLVLNWWPLALVLLGLEVLLAGYFCRQEVPRIKYDFPAIILVFLAGCVSLGLYGLTASGLADRLTRLLAAASFTVELPEARLAVPEGVRKIVVQGPDGGWQNLQILTGSSGGQVAFFGLARVAAASEEEAREQAGKAGLHTYQAGDTLFLQLGEVPSFRNWGPASYITTSTLVLPSDVEVEVTGRSQSALALAIDELEASWSIIHPGSIQVTLSPSARVQIEARGAKLEGNVPWEIQKGSEAGSPPSPARGTEVASVGMEPEVLGRVAVGKGGPLLKLSSSSIISVDVR